MFSDPVSSVVKYSRGCKYTQALTNQWKWQIPTISLYYSPSSLQTIMKWLFHFVKCRGGLSCDSSGELQLLASASACLQGNPDIPFQINLDSSAFINRAHRLHSIFKGRKKDTGQNVSPLKAVLHSAPLEIMRQLLEFWCNYNLFDCGCLRMMVWTLVYDLLFFFSGFSGSSSVTLVKC